MKPNGIIHLATAGVSFHPKYGKIEITPENLKDAESEFMSWPKDQRARPVRLGNHDPKSPAAGFMLSYIALPKDNPKDLYALTHWNDDGRDAVKRKKFAFISPEIYRAWVDARDSVKRYAIRAAALLNDPHLVALASPIALSAGAGSSEDIVLGIPTLLDSVIPNEVKQSLGDIDMELREQLCTKLGVDATASDEEVVSKVDALLKRVAESEEEKKTNLSAIEAKDADVVALSAQVTEAQAKADQLQTQLTDTSSKLAEAEKQKLLAVGALEFAALCAEGRALPREKERQLAAFVKDPDGTREDWKLRGQVLDTGKATGGADLSDGAVADLTEKQLAHYDTLVTQGVKPADAAVQAQKLK